MATAATLATTVVVAGPKHGDTAATEVATHRNAGRV